MVKDGHSTYLIGKIHPVLKCVMGHSVKPFSDLKQYYPNTKYITVLRDPVRRCLSEYQHRVRKYGTHSFESFLDTNRSNNMQCAFIAGSHDVEAAKRILSEEYFAVGILEQYDEFLALLSKELFPGIPVNTYGIQNVSKEDQKQDRQEILDAHQDTILEQNSLDVELYAYVKNEILPRQREKFGVTSSEVTKELATGRRAANKAFTYRHYIDYVVRKLYYKPTIRLLRILNGLPAGGY